MPKVHPTAIVSPKAKLADDVTIAPFAIIGDNVTIGAGSEVGSSVVLDGKVTIGKNCKIFSSAVIGSVPQDLKYKGEPTEVIIGDNNIIREFATIHRGTSAFGKTVIGDNNLIMAYVHIAHDCQIMNHTILANAVTLAGHIAVEDYSVVGGLTPVHQFCRIGAHSIVGGLSRINKDVVPYSKAAGVPTRIWGLNIIGLTRRGFSKEVIITIRSAFRLLFCSNLNTTQAVARIKTEVEQIPEVKYLLDFISASSRGIIKGPRNKYDECE
jgi:UDP-N-acetylglucosamine acyltransferase